MKTTKLVKRLQREVKANPQKALILGLLLLVAGYFWAPLLKGWVGSPEDPTLAAAPALPAGSAEPPVAGTPAAAAQAAWQDVASWIDRDSKMKPVTSDGLSRSPLERSSRGRAAAAWPVRQLNQFVQAIGDGVRLVGQQNDSNSETEVAQVLREVRPEEAGLILTSTIVGAKRRVALIGGKAYIEGATVASSSGSDPVEFQLRTVKRDSVVLSRNGKTYELKLPLAELAGSDRWELRGQ